MQSSHVSGKVSLPAQLCCDKHEAAHLQISLYALGTWFIPQRISYCIGVAAAWEALFVYDCAILLLTIYKSYQGQGQDIDIGRLSLAGLITRDDKHRGTLL